MLHMESHKCHFKRVIVVRESKNYAKYTIELPFCFIATDFFYEIVIEITIELILLLILA